MDSSTGRNVLLALGVGALCAAGWAWERYQVITGVNRRLEVLLDYKNRLEAIFKRVHKPEDIDSVMAEIRAVAPPTKFLAQDWSWVVLSAGRLNREPTPNNFTEFNESRDFHLESIRTAAESLKKLL